MSKIIIPTEIYSRVVGFYTPVSQWNKGKQEEYKNRKPYRLENEHEGILT